MRRKEKKNLRKGYKTRNKATEQDLKTFKSEFKRTRDGLSFCAAIWWKGIKYKINDYVYLDTPKKEEEKWIGQIKCIPGFFFKKFSSFSFSPFLFLLSSK